MRKLMRWAGVIGGGVIAAALFFVIYLGQNRIVVIANTGDSSNFTVFSEAGELPGQSILLQEDKEAGMSLKIPVETAIGPENILMENQYVGKRLVIFLRGATGFFYENTKITGYQEALQGASYTVESEGVTIYLQFSKLFEYESTLENGYLRVNVYKPSERYEKVVVLGIEPSEKISDKESAILYQIEGKLKALLENEGIRVYTGTEEDKALSVEEKQMLVEETDADLYLGLLLDEAEDKEQFGSYVCYNGLYFRPGLTNGTLADIMERELVTAINGKALGLTEQEDGILGELSVPAVIICPGYLSHEVEGQLLKQDTYQDKIASGIYQGVLKIFEGGTD